MAVRIARVAAPVLVVGLLGVGVAGAAWPGDQTQIAYPAPAVDRAEVFASIPTPVREPVLRRAASPTTKPTPTRTKAKPSPKACRA